MLLAETKLAELQTGIVDVSEGDSGDFNGKPANFSWAITEDPTDVSELKRLKISITYTDTTDGFTYDEYRLYSPSLNLSAEKMKDISNDPVQMQSLGGSSAMIQTLTEMLSEYPGGDKIMSILLRGGVPSMMALYSKLLGGSVSADQLLALLGGDDSSGSSLESTVADSTSSETSGGEPWTNYDTAGTGEKPTTQSSQSSTETASNDDKSTTTTNPSDSTGTKTGSDQTAQTGSKDNASSSSTGSMTKAEAIKRMQEMLRKLANKK
jgi:hypothetical protein